MTRKPILFLLLVLLLLVPGGHVAAQEPTTPPEPSDRIPAPEPPVPTLTFVPVTLEPMSTPTAPAIFTAIPTSTEGVSPTATASETPPATATVAVTPTLGATSTSTPTSTPTGTPLPLDSYEPDDVPEQARPLIIGETQLRTFASASGEDVDWVLVHLKPGRWEIAARTTTALYDPRLTLGALVADDEEGKNALLDTEVDQEGDHLLKVENLGTDGSGQYTLTLERLGDRWTPTPTLTPSPPVGAEDPWEPDAPPQAAPYAGPQRRTFNPPGDEDWVRYRLKAGLRVWFETSDLTGAADTEIHLFHDEDGLLTEADAWLAGDDDGGEGLGSRVSVEADADLWLTVLVRNRGAAWGPSVGYTFRVLTGAEVTPTPTERPAPTQVVTPEPKPTYTPYPTPTALPTWTPAPTWTPQPTLAALPTYTPAPQPPAPVYGGTGAAGSGDKEPPYTPPVAAAPPVVPAPPIATTAPAPAAPILPTPAAVPATLRLDVFLDLNRDGLLNRGEEVEGVLVTVSTPDRRWESEAYTAAGEAQIPLAGLPAEAEVVVLVPYLHRSGPLDLQNGAAESRIALELPAYPVYLP